MSSTKHNEQPGPNKSFLKMKDLSEATGVPKSTILLYVKQGLLPAPVKTSPNMAYYDPVCIEKIGFIKKIQASRRLPLAAIKGLIKEMDKGRDVTPLLELQTTLFGGCSEKMDINAFCKAANLSNETVKRFCDLELIIPLEKDVFDSHDLDLACRLAKSLDAGINPADLSFYPKIAKKIVSAEIQMREQYTKDLEYEDNARMTLEMTEMARGLRAYVIDRTLQKELIKFKGLKKK